MEVALTKILPQLNSFFYVFVRISTLFTMAPFFNSQLIPVRVRTGAAFLISMITFSFVDLKVNEVLFSLSGFILLIEEIFIGFCIGIIFHIVFQILVTAGEMIGAQSGFGFASLVDPQSHESLPIISEFFMMSTILLFLGFNGHLLLIGTIVDSFSVFPIGGFINNPPMMLKILQFSGEIFSSSLSIALPALCALLIVNITFGFISRAAPQINLMNIGFGIALIMGLFIMMTSYSAIMSHTTNLFEKGFSFIHSLNEAS